ncbi:universal stress protein [Fimbriiglobus ruber]|uniref:Universal stress protein family n=1 Tax=Fimbriiglobus ruber TaxID=1908690 RepID=A0A225DPD1_9BACT|nr:universal stress protein [Fimbriiglobus ruber]OWK38215.1 Universal stress protein family [Fimbriiglobus ruber]
MTAFKKILVPTDFSPAAAEAFRTAVALAKVEGGEVVVAHVTRAPAVVVENGQIIPGSTAAEPLNLWNMFRTAVSDDSNVPVTHEVVVAARVSAAGILGMLEKFGCDLIVIGSHGHGRLRRLLRGSITDGVVRRARCPVLVVKAPTARAAAPVKPATAQPRRVA